MRKSKNRYFYHIFVSLWDAPGAITLNIVWMEREFHAYKLFRSMYPSIFNSFPVIQTASAKKIAVFTYRSAHPTYPLHYLILPPKVSSSQMILRPLSNPKVQEN